MLSGQVESESEKNGSDPHHWSLYWKILLDWAGQMYPWISGLDLNN